MVNLAEAVLVVTNGLSILGPQGDCIITDVGNGPIITYWNTRKLGPQPDDKVFAAVTQQQVDVYYQNRSQASADSILTTGADEVATLHRAIIAAAGLTIAQVQAQLPAASIPPPKP